MLLYSLTLDLNNTRAGEFTDAVIRDLESICWCPDWGVDEQTEWHHAQRQDWRTCSHADTAGIIRSYVNSFIYKDDDSTIIQLFPNWNTFNQITNLFSLS